MSSLINVQIDNKNKFSYQSDIFSDEPVIENDYINEDFLKDLFDFVSNQIKQPQGNYIQEFICYNLDDELIPFYLKVKPEDDDTYIYHFFGGQGKINLTTEKTYNVKFYITDDEYVRDEEELIKEFTIDAKNDYINPIVFEVDKVIQEPRFEIKIPRNINEPLNFDREKAANEFEWEEHNFSKTSASWVAYWYFKDFSVTHADFARWWWGEKLVNEKDLFKCIDMNPIENIMNTNGANNYDKCIVLWQVLRKIESDWLLGVVGAEEVETGNRDYYICYMNENHHFMFYNPINKENFEPIPQNSYELFATLNTLDNVISPYE